MDDTRFNAIAARLEAESREAPTRYQLKVALLALVGFGLLILLMGGAALAIVLLATIPVALVLSSGKAALLVIKLAKFLWVLVVPLWLLLKSTIRALFTRLPAPTGHEVARTDAPALYAALDDMRARMRGPRFHHVLITQEMNAAVVQRPAFGLAGFPRNYLILGLPLLESLSPDEALAVVAHEYGHLAGSHSRFSAWIYRLRHTWGTIYGLSEQWSGWGGRALRWLVHLYAPYFNAYTWVLARANEYEADAASAQLRSAATTANALKRFNVEAARYDNFIAGTFEAVNLVPVPPTDLAERWSGTVGAAPPAEQARAWLAASLERQKQVHDTHPVLRDRLAALPGEADRAAELPPPLTAPSAAIAWLGGALAGLRDRLQREWAEQLRDGWRQRYEAIEMQRKRLAELRCLTDATPDQVVERLHLQVQLETNVDSLAEIAAFNAAHTNHSGGLYLEGALRLDRDDDVGVDLLERAMALEPEATTAACERIYGFMKKRGDDAAAESYSNRYRARRELEERRYREYHTFDPAHSIAPADLSDEDLSLVRSNVSARRQRGIRRIWVVRRILPSDPSVKTYLICVDPTWWARLLRRGPKIVEALSEGDWPMPAFLCALVGANRRALLERLESLPIPYRGQLM